jgi:hypothetical protein
MADEYGRYVTYNADQGGVFEPLTVGAAPGRYVTFNADAGGQYVPYSEEERAAINARLQAERQSEYQAASDYLASNPLAITGDQIATQYGNVDISRFRPITTDGVTGSTSTQLTDPATGAPVFLSNPNDPFSYTYDNTGTPAIGGTLEQAAANYKPFEQNGAFGPIVGDLLSAVKDPYFRNFAIAAATMAAAAALAPAAGASGVGSSAASTGATAFPVDFSSTITTGGLGGGGAGAVGGAAELGAGGLGSLTAEQASNLMLYDILPGGLQTPANISSLGGLVQSGGELLAGPYGSLIKGGLTLGGAAAANALKPKVDTSSTTSGLTSEQLRAMVAGMPSMIDQYNARGQTGMSQSYNGYNAPATIAQLFPSFNLASAQAPTVGSTNAPVYGAGRFAPLI